jgi:mutator protein MutT
MPRPLQPDGRVHGVVVAIRRADGRYLCIRRSNTVLAPNKVCFPGGAIEPGESQHDAVVRETREELGIDVRPLKQCWRHDFADKPLTLWGWIAEFLSGEITPDPNEVAETLWLSGREAIDHPDAIATNRDFIACLESMS